MTLSDGQRKLAKLWKYGFTISVVILVVQSIAGYYGDKVTYAWSWLLPYVLPIFTTVLSACAADAKKTNPRISVHPVAYELSIWLSVVYLFFVDVSLLAGNFTPMGPLELMKTSTLWLAPMQGLLGTSLGTFFVKRGKTT